MKTLKLLTITVLIGTFGISTLNAQERPQDRVNDKRLSVDKNHNIHIKKNFRVNDVKKRRVEEKKSHEVTRDRYKRPHKVKNSQTRVNVHPSKIYKRPHTIKHAVKFLKRGDRGLKVKTLQRALRKERLYRGRVDGIFGKGLQRSVKKFQRQHRLFADGVAGAKTLRALHIR